MKKTIKFLSGFVSLPAAKKIVTKQSKLYAHGPLYPQAKVEFIQATQLFKTNQWSQKQFHNLPIPTKNDYLVFVTYKVPSTKKSYKKPKPETCPVKLKTHKQIFAKVIEFETKKQTQAPKIFYFIGIPCRTVSSRPNLLHAS